MTKALGFIAVMLWAVSAAAQTAPVSAADEARIRAVVAGQLAAFQRDDANAAFAVASLAIQQIFQTPDIFMQMVKTGYAPVYRPRKVEFRGLVDTGGIPVQRVYLVGPDGVPVIALYPMERQADGNWRIDGCTLVRADDEMA